MDFAKVDVEIRSQKGKGGARKTRAAGRVPAILYGHKQDPLPIHFEERGLIKSLDKEKKRNTVFALSVKGGSATDAVTAMIRDVQIDAISRRIVHVDFLRIDPDEEVRVRVPIALTGKALGVINGGNLHQNIHDMYLVAKAAAIPAHIDVDVSGLDIGDALHVSDIKFPAGVRSLLAGKESVASVVAPKAEKVEVAEVAAAAEGAAAPAAEGAAAAAGAAAPAAGAEKKAPEKKEKGK